MAPPMNADAMKWSAAPPVLPQGAQMSVISGDPSKDGLYVVRLKMPANYKIPAHNHPTTEYVTVISGDFHAHILPRLQNANERGVGVWSVRRSARCATASVVTW